jgi:integrase
MEFLRVRGRDLLTATETDLLEYRHWRTQRQDDPIERSTWEKESAAINGVYGWLVDRHYLRSRPWRLNGRRDTLRNGVSRDMKVRHMTLDQYLYFRDVGLGGQTPEATLDVSFRGWSPHRNRAGAELALLTGMRLQEWSTVLLPELGIGAAKPGERVEFRLAACAKFGRPRTVGVPAGALSMISTYLALERREVISTAQRTLKDRRDELFVVDDVDGYRDRLSGVLDGRRVTRSIAAMPPQLRRMAVLDTAGGLEPLAVFVGAGGRMLLPFSWDKVRWGAWRRMQAHAANGAAPMLPRACWRFHDLRHSYAQRHADAGTPVDVLRELMDHKSVQTTMGQRPFR